MNGWKVYVQSMVSTKSKLSRSFYFFQTHYSDRNTKPSMRCSIVSVFIFHREDDVKETAGKKVDIAGGDEEVEVKARKLCQGQK